MEIIESDAFRRKREWVTRRDDTGISLPFATELIQISALLPEKVHLVPEVGFPDQDYKETPTRGRILYNGELHFKRKPYPDAETVECGSVIIGYDIFGNISVETNLWLGNPGWHEYYLLKNPHGNATKMARGVEALSDNLVGKIGGRKQSDDMQPLFLQDRPFISPFTTASVSKTDKFTDGGGREALVTTITGYIKHYLALEESISR